MKAVAFSILFLFTLLIASIQGANVLLTGVNEAGAGFGSDKIPGRYGYDYIYPQTSSIQYFRSKGMNVFRVSFLWERIQPNITAPFDINEVARLTNTVNFITQNQGCVALLDPHNYARYRGNVIGQADSSISANDFASFWGSLSELFKSNPLVAFGLMNEPNSMNTTLWLNDANAAIAAIRATGALNLILVPGNFYSGVESWVGNNPTSSNSLVMKNVVDPEDNFAFEVHQYFDRYSTGTIENCSSSDGPSRFRSFTNWARSNGYKAFLGEFAGANNEVCKAAVLSTLDYMNNNTDVWLGWTWWAAGPWWGTYMFSIEPRSGNVTDAPQMEWLMPHLAGNVSISISKVNVVGSSSDYSTSAGGRVKSWWSLWS